MNVPSSILECFEDFDFEKSSAKLLAKILKPGGESFLAEILKYRASVEGNASNGKSQISRRRDNPSKRPKLGHVLILPLSSISPSPENDKLYRPINPNDPEIIALSKSIKEHGVQDPLKITEDNFILSGHRRYAAAKLAGLKNVPCLIVKIKRGDPQFLTLLRECNRQREKSRDEKLREAVVSANPEESHRLLLEHRKRQSRIDGNFLTITGEKTRAEISKAKRPFLKAIQEVMEERRNFWPLSDRQIHYALLNDPPLIHASKLASVYRNDLKSYKALCDLVTRARLAGFIPMNAIHDPTRPATSWSVHRDVSIFLEEETENLFKGFYRDLMQSQANHIEIVGEKNTVESIIRPIAMKFCIPYTIGRGYCSLPPRAAIADRFSKSGKEKLILLVLTDFDPDGEEIAHSLARSLRDDFSISQIEVMKVALTEGQVIEYGLPPVMKAKATSVHYKKFTAEHGKNVFELEALSPGELQKILGDAINSLLDDKAFNHEIDEEKKDAASLERTRRIILAALGKLPGGPAESKTLTT